MAKLCDRLEAELRPRFEPGAAGVVRIPEVKRATSVWTGGSILASLSTFEKLWVTSLEYKEDPAAALHRLANLD